MFNTAAFLSYVFIVTFTPGPNNITSMASANKYGYKRTLEFIFGVTSGFFLLMLLCSYFNLMLFNIIPKIKPVMSIIGAAYMLYLAFKIMSSKDDLKNPEQHSKEIPQKKENLFLRGFLLQFVNPKAILYGITVVANFIMPFYQSAGALFLFSLFFGVVVFASNTSWALFGSLFKRFLSNYSRQFNIVMGILLIYSAASISGIFS